MSQLTIVEELDGVAQLVDDVSSLIQCVWVVVILFLENRREIEVVLLLSVFIR